MAGKDNLTASERKIRELILEGGEQFDSRIREEEDPEVLAALSSLRLPLLSWYPFGTDFKALEVGSGFGAVTGVLLDRCRSVTALEPDGFRAGLLSKRYEGRNNLTVVRSLDEAGCGFDCIVVPDWSGFFRRTGSGGSSLAALLKELGRLLCPGGTLLVCVRNRLGAHYLSGGTDDVLTVPFAAIEREVPGLLTRKEILAAAGQAGLRTAQVYYPLPGAAFPQVIASDGWTPAMSFRDRLIYFSLYGDTEVSVPGAAAELFRREGLLPETADDFLFELRGPGQDPGAGSSGSRQVLGAVLSCDREKANAFRLLFLSDGTVRKEAAFPEGKATVRTLHENHEALRRRGILVIPEELSSDGTSLLMPDRGQESLADTVLRWTKEAEGISMKERIFNVLDILKDNILRASDILTLTKAERQEEAARWGVKDPDSLSPFLENGYIDMIPYNCFLREEGYGTGGDALYLEFYDQEFTLKRCPAAYVMYRAVRYTWLHAGGLEQILPLRDAMERYGITEETEEAFRRREDRFVGENRNRDLYASLYRHAWPDPSSAEANRRLLLARRREADGCSGICAPGADPELAAIHAVQLDLLHKFDDICTRHGLRYTAVHGTLLGAVRHKGFIPWDDDVDLAMPRDDYDRLVKIMAGERREPYFFQTPENDPECFYGGYGKFRNNQTAALENKNLGKHCSQGIFIDVFPLDYIEEGSPREKERFRRIVRLQRLLMARCYPLYDGLFWDARGSRVSAYYILGPALPHRLLVSRLHKALTACPVTDTLTIRACYYAWGVNRNRFPAKDLDHLKRIPFEDMTIPVPENCDGWLKDRYGADYLAVPPPEKQKRSHKIKFDTERSYLSYLEKT